MGKILDEYKRQYEKTLIEALDKRSDKNKSVKITRFPVWVASVWTKEKAIKNPLPADFLIDIKELREADPEMADVVSVGLCEMTSLIKGEIYETDLRSLYRLNKSTCEKKIKSMETDQLFGELENTIRNDICKIKSEEWEIEKKNNWVVYDLIVQEIKRRTIM